MRSTDYKLYKYLRKVDSPEHVRYGKKPSPGAFVSKKTLSSATEGFQTDDQSYSSLSMDTAMQSCAEFPENFLFIFKYSIHLFFV
jgi:hypothetical protein